VREAVSDPKESTRAADSPDVAARIRDGLSLVATIASQVKRQIRLDMSREELASFGHEGLLGAARSYDPTRGVPFPAWAALRVRGAMIDGVRASGTLPRRLYQQLRALESADATQDALVEENAARPPASPADADDRLNEYLANIATAMALGIVATVSHEQASDADALVNSPEAIVGDAEVADAMRAAIARLPDAERKLVERHYFGEVTLDEAAREIGLSKSWGSRIHARAIEMIARDLKRSRVAP
jgi:RNA polymerase sigma factor for flagellar operon FliA